nr:hypothetical protein [Tanacetum cinerariifolium]
YHQHTCLERVFADLTLSNLKVQTSSAVVSLNLSRGNLSSLAMGKSSGSGNSSLALPILNPNEFDLWKMRLEKYFLMTNYSLWEVILNGDSPAPTRVIKCVVQLVAPTTTEQRLARKNKLKARALRSMRLKLRVLPLLASTQNIAFVSFQTTDSTTEPVSAVASVSAASAKILVSALPNVDTGRERILEQIDLLPWDLICQRWSATTAIGKDTFQRSVAMTRVFRQKRNQPTMPSWHSPLQVLPVLTMRYHSGDGYHDVLPLYTGIFMPLKPDLVFHDACNTPKMARSGI